MVYIDYRHVSYCLMMSGGHAAWGIDDYCADVSAGGGSCCVAAYRRVDAYHRGGADMALAAHRAGVGGRLSPTSVLWKLRRAIQPATRRIADARVR